MKALALLAVLCGLAVAADQAQPRVVDITARKFRFEPEEIHLAKGQPVVLRIRSVDVTHGFRIEGLKLRVDVTTGAVAEVPFTPVKEGTFTFECDVFCGIEHDDMSGTLFVDK